MRYTMALQEELCWISRFKIVIVVVGALFISLLSSFELSSAFVLVPPTTTTRISSFKSSTGKTINSQLSSSSSSSSSASMISKVLQNPQFPKDWPYTEQDFKRIDTSNDTIFYQDARLVYHIDDACRAALTKYYDEEVFTTNTIQQDDTNQTSLLYDVLDICSSWTCHYPNTIQEKAKSVVGLGMNEYELQQNPILTQYVVQDLNTNPILPFEDNTFDIVTCCVSFDYLIYPLQVMKEIGRILRPKTGRCIISISNRCFPTKAIQLWLQTNDLEHVYMIGSFFHYSECFTSLMAYDKSPNPGRSDPLYIITANKKNNE